MPYDWHRECGDEYWIGVYHSRYAHDGTRRYIVKCLRCLTILRDGASYGEVETEYAAWINAGMVEWRF